MNVSSQFKYPLILQHLIVLIFSLASDKQSLKFQKRFAVVISTAFLIFFESNLSEIFPGKVIPLEVRGNCPEINMKSEFNKNGL